MDLVDPLVDTLCGNKYILTLTDYYMKWAKAAPFRDKTASFVADIVFLV